jgi:hypothetical protein
MIIGAYYYPQTTKDPFQLKKIKKQSFPPKQSEFKLARNAN